MSHTAPFLRVIDLRSASEATEAGQNRSFQGVFLLHKVTSRKAKNGMPYWAVEVSDATGSFSFNCFDSQPAFPIFQGIQEGCVIQLEGTIEFYNERLSPRIANARILPESEVAEEHWFDKLVPCSAEDPQALWSQYEALANEIQNETLRATVHQVMKDIGEVFRIAPGALIMHHAYRYGLLEHTVHATRLGRTLLPLYPQVNADLAIAGLLLHDVGKVLEYSNERSAQKTRIGVLQGHVVLGYRIVRKAALQCKLEADWLERLEHIILSHQGELEWGAAILAATPEAVFVSLADNFDAKMGMVQKALHVTPSDETFSDFLPGLRVRLLTQPMEGK